MKLVRQARKSARYPFFILLLSGFITGSPFAQGVPIPDLKTTEYSSSKMQPYFQSAGSVDYLQNWESIVNSGLESVLYEWELEVDAKIQNLVNSTSQDDILTDKEDYRNYIREQLALVKDTERQNWVLAAELDIQGKRQDFLNRYVRDAREEEELEGQEAMSQAGVLFAASLQEKSAEAKSENPDVEIIEDIEQETIQWQDLDSALVQQFADARSRVQSEYTKTLQEYAAERDRLLGEIDARDQEFQTSIASIEASEASARTSLSGFVDELEADMASGDLHDLLYDGDGNLTESGVELQGLLENIRTLLDNNSSLVTVATAIQEYLVERQADAIERKGEAEGDILNWASPRSTISDINADSDYISYVKEYLQASGAEKEEKARVLWDFVAGENAIDGNFVSITGIDICGASGGGTGSTHDCYVSDGAGNGAFTYQTRKYSDGECAGVYVAAGAEAAYACTQEMKTITEGQLLVEGSIQYEDNQAIDRRDKWLGVETGLGALISTWDEIIPALVTWETQVAAYKTAYASWLVNANVTRASINSTYATSKASLTGKKNSWMASLDAMEKEQRNVLKISWLNFKDNVLDLGDTAAEIVKKYLQNNAPEGEKLFGEGDLYDGAEMVFAGDQDSVDDLETEALAIDEVEPDTETMVDLVEAAEDSLNAATNVAAMEQLEEMAEAIRQQMIDELKKDLLLQGYEIGEGENEVFGRRKIPSGTALLTSGADATKVESYYAQEEEQVLKLLMPQEFTIPTGGELGDTWDMESLRAEFDRQMSELQEGQSRDLFIADANKFAFQRRMTFQQEARNRAQEAALEEELKQTSLLGGEALKQLVKQRIEEERRRLIVEEASKYGLSPELVMVMTGDMSMGDAISSYGEKFVKSQIMDVIMRQKVDEMYTTLSKTKGETEANAMLAMYERVLKGKGLAEITRVLTLMQTSGMTWLEFAAMYTATLDWPTDKDYNGYGIIPRDILGKTYQLPWEDAQVYTGNGNYDTTGSLYQNNGNPTNFLKAFANKLQILQNIDSEKIDLLAGDTFIYDVIPNAPTESGMKKIIAFFTMGKDLAPVPENFADELAYYHDKEVPGDYWYNTSDPEEMTDYHEDQMSADFNWLGRLAGGVLDANDDMEEKFWNQDDFANNMVWGVGGGVLFYLDFAYRFNQWTGWKSVDILDDLF